MKLFIAFIVSLFALTGFSLAEKKEQKRTPICLTGLILALEGSMSICMDGAEFKMDTPVFSSRRVLGAKKEYIRLKSGSIEIKKKLESYKGKGVEVTVCGDFSMVENCKLITVHTCEKTENFRNRVMGK